jgi:hypothetical protein
MASPLIKILGVYSPRQNASDFQAFVDATFHGLDDADEIGDLSPEARTEIRKDIERELGGAVLVEALVEHPDETFSMGAFVHPDPELPSINWQVAWCEKYLTPDGDRLLGEYLFDEVPSEPCFRVAFYIHYWKHENGLNGLYGALELPPVQPMPKRLWQLAPYEQVG